VLILHNRIQGMSPNGEVYERESFKITPRGGGVVEVDIEEVKVGFFRKIWNFIKRIFKRK